MTSTSPINRAQLATYNLRSPQQALGLALPLGKRLAHVAERSWVYLLIGISVIGMVSYVFQMNHTATKGFALRDQERQLERLQITVASLEDQVAQKRAIRSIEDRVSGLGYVAADRMEFIDVSRDGVAVAR